jgi:hypothetical protein
MAGLFELLNRTPSMALLEESLKKNASKKPQNQANKIAKLQAQLAKLLGPAAPPVTTPPITGQPSQVVQNVMGSDGKIYQVITTASPPLVAGSNGQPILPIQQAVTPAAAPLVAPAGGGDLISGIDPKLLMLGGAGIIGAIVLTRKKGRR